MVEDMVVRHDLDAFLQHESFVRAVARAILGGDPLVDDVVQETWLAAIRRAPAPSRGWLGAVTRNRALNVLRSRRRRERREGAAGRPAAPSPEEVLERQEASRRVVAALLRQSEPVREALLLRFFEDLPPRRIAAQLGVPVETVKSRLKRGLRRLRAELEPDLQEPGIHHGLAALAGVGLAKASGTVVVGAAMQTKKLTAAVFFLLLLAAGSIFWLRSMAEEDSDRESRTQVHAPGTDPSLAESRVGDGGSGERSKTKADSEEAREPAALSGTEKDRAEITGSSGGGTTDAIPALGEWELNGRVSSSEGPVSGARVRVVARQGGVRWVVAETVAGRDGLYRADLAEIRALAGVRRSLTAVMVEAAADGYYAPKGQLGFRAGFPIDATDPYVRTVNVTLHRGTSIRGQVVHADGSPAEGAKVVLLAEGREWREMASDSNGRYAFGGFFRNPCTVRAHEAYGGLALSESFVHDPQKETEVPKLVLGSKETIEGRLVRPDGVGIPGVAIVAFPSRKRGARRGGSLGAGRTGPDGAFRIPVFRAGGHDLSLFGLRAVQVQAKAEAGARGLRLVLDAVRIRIRTVDPSGAGVGGTQLLAYRWDGENRTVVESLTAGAPLPEGAVQKSDWRTWVQTRGPEGEALLLSGPESVWLLRTFVRGFAPTETLVRLKPGETTRVVELVVGGAGGRGRIAVEVRSPSGEVLPFSGQVEAPGGGFITPLRSAGGGKADLPVGTVRLRVQPGIRSGNVLPDVYYKPLVETVRIVAGKETRVQLTARLWGRLEMRLHLEEGVNRRFLNMARTRIFPRGSEKATEVNWNAWDEKGKRILKAGRMRPGRRYVSWRHIEPGDYTFRVDRAGHFQDLELPIVVRAGETTKLDLHLKKK